MINLNVTLTMATIECCKAGCGIMFAVPVDWDKGRRRDHEWWYCPNGHAQHYTAESDLEKAQAQLARERAAHDQTKSALADAERQAVKKAREAKRLARRTANGVCPCCNRSFLNLQRHMATKHPEHVESVKGAR